MKSPIMSKCKSVGRNRLISRIHDRALRDAARKYATGRLVDIGCGTKPYRELFAPYVAEHFGIDHAATPHETSQIDQYGTAYDIPCEDHAFDTALCTAVLEHLEEPELALRECFRVLRPGGCAIYSVPFIWQLHEAPRDFFRYSRYGLKYIFEKAGFVVLEIRPLAGFWVTFGQMVSYLLHRFNRGPLRWLRIIDAVSSLLQLVFNFLDRVDVREEWAWMHILVARRP